MLHVFLNYFFLFNKIICLAKEMYEGTVRLLMEYGATVLEHTELLQKGFFYSKKN